MLVGCPWNMPFINKVKVFWPRVETRPSYCIFLPFGTPDSGSKFRRYQVFIRYYLASAGMTKGSRLSKRKRNVLFLSNMHYWPSARWTIWLDIWPNSCFCILLDFLKVLYFFFSFIFFLVGYATRLGRSLVRCANSCIEARFTFKNLWEVDL